MCQEEAVRSDTVRQFGRRTGAHAWASEPGRPLGSASQICPGSLSVPSQGPSEACSRLPGQRPPPQTGTHEGAPAVGAWPPPATRRGQALNAGQTRKQPRPTAARGPVRLLPGLSGRPGSSPHAARPATRSPEAPRLWPPARARRLPRARARARLSAVFAFAFPTI